MDNHLTEIEIKDFKCFKDFKADGFKRVNLIGGKNNVGKTAFMEACFLMPFASNKFTITAAVASLSAIEKLRNKKYDKYTMPELILLLEKFSGIYIKSNIGVYSLETKKEALKTIVSINSKEEILSFNKETLFLSPESIHFISCHSIDDKLIGDIYDKIKTLRKRDELNSILNQFDKNVLEFEIISNIPKVFLNDKQEFVDISEMGHGLKRYITIIGSILQSKNNYIYIDEIENGIHYSNFDKLWKIILKVSKAQNVQVFVTTHSNGCIESYAKVSAELKDEDISFISLYKDRENNIESVTLNNQEIQNRIELGLDNR